MEIKELGQILFNMYQDAPRGEKYTNLYLFGIKYNKEIKSFGIKEVVEQSAIPICYKTEISKAIRLSRHVILK